MVTVTRTPQADPGENRPVLWVDVSTSRIWSGPHVGIVRVEVMVIEHLLINQRFGLRFCYFDLRRRLHRELSRSQTEALLDRLKSTAVQGVPKHHRWHDVITAGLKKSTKAQRGLRILPQNIRQPLKEWISALWKLGLASQALLRFLALPNPFRKNSDPPAYFRDGDAYLSMGSDWCYNDLDVVQSIRQSRGLRVCLFCYDLLPVYHPHFFPKQQSLAFRKHASQILNCADLVFAISSYTEQQLIRFACELQIKPPPTLVVNLGADQSCASSKAVTNLKSQRYVLCVGTVEIRKNHRLLYQLWMRMRSDPELPDPPALVLAGRRGWRVDDLFTEMEENPEVQNTIQHLECPSDQELNWLYDHCLFTVFPSFGEGLGLPVIESLAHGKCCLCSNTTSLPEAGQNLSVLLDPLDFMSWYAAIKTLILDDSMRTDREARICDQFKLNTWAATADAISTTVETMLHP